MKKQDKKQSTTLVSFRAERADNGWVLYYGCGEQSLSARAGWIPQTSGPEKKFVSKTSDPLLAKIKDILSDKA
jgi:hypothetical protein